MAKTSLNTLDSRAPLEHMVIALARSVVDEGVVLACECAWALACATLGGEARARSVAAMLAYAEAEWANDSSLLDEEDLATAAAHRIILPLQTDRLQARIVALEAKTAGTATCTAQGLDGKAYSHGLVPRTFIGRHGKMPVRVRWVVCQNPECGRVFSDACRQLGRDGGRFTPGCAEVVSQMATALPHGKAVTLLGQMLQIDISEHAVQDLVEARGATLLALDDAEATAHLPRDSTGLERSYGRPADAVPVKDAPEMAYLEVDGVLPITRELQPELSPEHPGARGGKGRKYKLEGREVKNAVLYKASDQAQEMPSRGCLLDRRYVSHLGHWLPFAALVWLTMLKLRFDQAKLLVILSDGAEWIRTLGSWLPMGNRLLLILDFFHAAHRIWEVARAPDGDGTDLCKQRARLWCEVVEAGHVDYII